MLRRVTLERTDVSEERIAFLHSVLRLLVTANVVPSSPIFVTLMKEAIRSSEMSVLTRATRRNFSEEVILNKLYPK
jgi:small neutral amino acid transporter SnatA (MarC family)